MIAEGDAILFPITVPLSCLKIDLPCLKMLFFRTHSADSIKESVEIFYLSSIFSFPNCCQPFFMSYIRIKTYYIYYT